MKNIGIEMERKIKAIISQISSEKCPDEMYLVSEYFWLWQLGEGEYPLNDENKKDTFNEACDEQTDLLLPELEPFISALECLGEKCHIDAMVLLGQYFYGAPKSKFLERQPSAEEREIINTLISETIGVSGAPSKYDDLSGRRDIKQNHKKAASLFVSAYKVSPKKASFLIKYYLYKLENEGMLNEKMSVEEREVISNYDIGLLIELGVQNFRLLSQVVAKEKARAEAVNAKAETEEMMQWIAHTTNSDLTSLELYVKREHAETSEVLTKRIRQDIETFSLMSSDQKAFISAVKKDISGTMVLYDLICKSLISTMLFMLSPRARELKLINHRYFDLAKKELNFRQNITRMKWVKSSAFPTMQRKLFKELLCLNDKPDMAILWIREHFGEIIIDIKDDANITMTQYGKKSAVLSYIFGQFISNALKYGTANCNQPMLSINCRSDAKYHYFSCSNGSRLRDQKGDGKGLMAMDMMLAKLNEPALNKKKSGDMFIVSCQLSKELMGGK